MHQYNLYLVRTTTPTCLEALVRGGGNLEVRGHSMWHNTFTCLLLTSHLPSRVPASAHFTGILSRYPGLQELRHLPALLSWHSVLYLHSWLHHLHRRSHRWSPCHLPSVPLLTMQGILCIWNHISNADQLPLPPFAHIWSYMSLPSGSLALQPQPFTSLTSPSTAPFLLGHLCRRCGKPNPLRSTVLLSSPKTPCWTGLQSECCWYMPLILP